MSWRRVMVTDSKYFLLQAKGRPAGRWCTAKTRGSIGRVKHSVGVHVYMGITYWGSTQLIFVTGTHKQRSQYTSPKTNRPYSGVCSQEYNDVITQYLKPEDDRLFQQSPKWSGNWQLQQDNAPPHKTAQNMALIASTIPAGHFLLLYAKPKILLFSALTETLGFEINDQALFLRHHASSCCELQSHCLMQIGM